jgi:acyl carrier protein
MRERALSIIAAVLKVPVSTLTDESSPDTIATWDSLMHLQVVVAIEEAFDVQFEPDELDALQTVGSIVSAVKERA